ncbi:hypothetical protein P7C73_g6264, partial [Tremellales sp. Uapishka_1]
MDSSFPEPAKERGFQKEAWFTQKQGALASAGFFLVSWALTVGLSPKPLTKFNWYAYFGIAGFFTLPLIVFVALDWPRTKPKIWQPWLFCATWCWAYILIGEMNLCGFFAAVNHCGNRNFINMLGFAFGQPVLSLLALRQNRLFASIGPCIWLILAGVLLMTGKRAPVLFFRNMVNFGLFHAFLIFTSFLKERSDRQMFALRQQLKIQYRATQSAQVMERRASDSKKRFVSYIFHEVRVPLNTALLAVQNLDGEDVFRGLHEDQAEMVHGLMGSLTMMEKVLNDVLSFNRMESGKFAQARKPFEFHKSIQLVALSHRMQAQMAGIDLIVDLDRDIDKIGGVFVGDEMRLRQVASNLVSNSVKFTQNGSVRIVTKLLYPRLEPTPSTELDDPLNQAAINLQKTLALEGKDVEMGSVMIENGRMSTEHIKEKAEEQRKHKAVIRVEIHDTGVGLRKQDVIENRLFSPYVQTEIGRRQGGKGSGLGLALVRQIVKLSNGRLGVESEFGKGSMFWFEMPFALPPPPKSKSNDIGLRPPLTRQHTSQLPNVKVKDQINGSPGLTSAFEMTKMAPLEERPPMTMTESTRPLLLHSPTENTGMDAIPMEDVIINTFPPVDGTTPDGGPPSSDSTYVDPFATVGSSVGQRPSLGGWSDTTMPELPSPKKEPERATPPETPEPPLCTLVVDDDKLTRMLMSRMLTRLGHQVTTAENGKIALDMIRSSFMGLPNSPKYDVVFLDNQMPLMTGVEVAREVREMGCPLYIVGCTGNALREDQEEYIAAGADGIIPKPIHQKTVLEMIKEARRRVAGETSPKDLQSDEVGGPSSPPAMG